MPFAKLDAMLSLLPAMEPLDSPLEPSLLALEFPLPSLAVMLVLVSV
jgi:hypothetical protein